MRLWASRLSRSRTITTEEFDRLNEIAFKLENGLLKLVESLERKKLDGDWVDSLIVKECNENYGGPK